MPSTSRKKNAFCGQQVWLIAALILIILIGVGLYLTYTHKKGARFLEDQCQNTCISKKCVDAAVYTNQNTDQRVEPCQNFYSHACGKWIERSGQETRTVRHEMKRTLLTSIKEMLDSFEGNSSDTAGKLKTAYDSCTSNRASELNAVPSAKKFFNLLGMGEWPKLPERFRFSNPSLEEVISILISYNEFPFMELKKDVSGTFTEFSRNKEMNYFTVTAKDYAPPKIFRSAIPHLVYHFGGTTQDVDSIERDYISVSDEILEFLPEKKCARNCRTDSVPVECSRVRQRHSKLICNITQNVIKRNNLENSYSAAHVLLSQSSPDMILDDLVFSNSHRSLANYLAITFTFEHLPDLDNILRDLLFDRLYAQHKDFEPPKDREEFCIIWLTTLMPQPLGQVYVSNTFTLEILKDVNNIVNSFVTEAANSIIQQDWIEEPEKTKLSHTLSGIGSSLFLWLKYLKDGTFDELMVGYQPTRRSFLWNILEFQKQQFKFFLLHMISETAMEVKKIFDSNAQHTPGFVDLSLGILIPPVYEYGRPQLLNYASLGFIIAHEIGHEIEFFFKTNEINDQTLQNVVSKFQCLTKQYSKYTMEKTGEKVNGTVTVYENFADLIAIELTEKVLAKIAGESQEKLEICFPNVPFSTRQMLYLLLTQFWCETPIAEIDTADTHTIAKFRIIGVMQNAKEFSDVFKCSRGSYMNLANKCSFFEQRLK